MLYFTDPPSACDDLVHLSSMKFVSACCMFLFI